MERNATRGAGGGDPGPAWAGRDRTRSVRRFERRIGDRQRRRLRGRLDAGLLFLRHIVFLELVVAGLELRHLAAGALVVVEAGDEILLARHFVAGDLDQRLAVEDQGEALFLLLD